MNMAAHCTICRIRTGIADGCCFEFANEVEHILHAAFHIGAEGPITKTDQASCQIDGAVASQKQSVANITDVPKPAEVLHHRVKFVPVKHQDASAVGRQVDRVLLDRDASIIAEIATHVFIVVPGDVNYFGAFSALAKEFLDNIVVFLRPENALLQRENINKVSDYVQRLEVILSEKIEQRFRLAVFVAEVNIRNPNCSPVRNAICWHWHLHWFTIQWDIKDGIVTVSTNVYRNYLSRWHFFVTLDFFDRRHSNSHRPAFAEFHCRDLPDHHRPGRRVSSMRRERRGHAMLLVLAGEAPLSKNLSPHSPKSSRDLRAMLFLSA
jgi:hypothetical protein